jgi:succinoglycan biosynthesis transport protein ExoP
MVDFAEEQNSEQPDVERYFDIIRRRHLQLLAPLFLTWLAVWGASWVLKPVYKSSTNILVEQPTMPENYVAPNVNENLQGRLQSITQQILSPTRLSLIIDKLHLYPDAPTMDDRVTLMKKDISIDLVRDTRNNEINAFTVAFSAHDPEKAQQVTTQLTDLFINENLRVRQEESQGTTKFIEQQLAEARDVLSAQEAKVRAFQAVHEGALPTQQASNMTILSGLQSQLQNEEDALNQAKQQHVYLQALIEQSRATRGTVRADGTPSDVAQLNLELRGMRSQLIDLRARYTDEYPDVLKLKDQIAKTEKIRDEMVANPSKVPEDAGARDGEGLNSTSPLGQLQGQLKANQLEITNREHGIANLQQRINEYQGRLNEAPSTEQQLAELTRGYDQSKANYDELLRKENSSAMATSMEKLQEGERFTVLDAPSLPAKPDFPNRLKFCGIGLGLGLVVGVLVAAGLEFADDRMHRDSDLKEMLPATILSEIPEVVRPTDEAKKRRGRVLSWAATSLIVVMILAGATISVLYG